MPPFHTCPTCGHMWRHGMSGEHSCSSRLASKVKDLEARLQLANMRRPSSVELSREELNRLLQEVQAAGAEKIIFVAPATPTVVL